MGLMEYKNSDDVTERAESREELLIPENTTQMYNEPGKAVMLNTYNNKTDIVLCFSSEKEIPYDYRNEEQQRNIILNQFSGLGWRTPELLEEVKNSNTFYFDKGPNSPLAVLIHNLIVIASGKLTFSAPICLANRFRASSRRILRVIDQEPSGSRVIN